MDKRPWETYDGPQSWTSGDTVGQVWSNDDNPMTPQMSSVWFGPFCVPPGFYWSPEGNALVQAPPNCYVPPSPPFYMEMKYQNYGAPPLHLGPGIFAPSPPQAVPLSPPYSPPLMPPFPGTPPNLSPDAIEAVQQLPPSHGLILQPNYQNHEGYVNGFQDYVTTPTGIPQPIRNEIPPQLPFSELPDMFYSPPQQVPQQMPCPSYGMGGIQIQGPPSPYNASHGNALAVIPDNPQRKRSGGPKRLGCCFCYSNRECEAVWRSHLLRVDGEVRCPILLEYVCPLCNVKGDHTIRYCPQNPDASKIGPRIKAGHNSAGMLLRKYNSRKSRKGNKIYNSI